MASRTFPEPNTTICGIRTGSTSCCPGTTSLCTWTSRRAGCAWDDRRAFIDPSSSVLDDGDPLRRRDRMMIRNVRRAATAALVLTLGSLAAPASAPAAPAATDDCASYQPQVPSPDHFVQTIDNPYFPLPVGRTLVYDGVKDGQSQIDRVTVTSKTKVIEGITATTVNDVATHRGSLLEKTKDWYAQDDQGNVWYLGEDTRAFLPNGRVDRSGSWESGVGGAKPGIIMEADPQVPDAYRQECLSGEAEDMAWVVQLGGTVH